MSNPNFPGPYGQDDPPGSAGHRKSRGPGRRYRDIRGRNYDKGDQDRWSASVDRPYGSGAGASYADRDARRYEAGLDEYGNGQDAADDGGYRRRGDNRGYGGEYEGFDRQARADSYNDQYGQPQDAHYGADDYGHRADYEASRYGDDYGYDVGGYGPADYAAAAYRAGGPEENEFDDEDDLIDAPRGIGRYRRGGGRESDRVRGNLLQRIWRGSWWRRWTWKKGGLVAGGLSLATALLMLVGFLVAYNHYQIPTNAQAFALAQSSTVYYADGKPVGAFTSNGINRTFIPLSKMGKYTVPAILALEDRNFWHEGGISITGTLRALYVDLTGSGQQGGSTITEQLVKQYYEAPGAPRSMTTKLKEIIVAMKLAKERSKIWILRQYLNIVSMGPFYASPGAYGVQAAAETYFGIPASKLNLAQSCMVASMPNDPYGFDPRPNGGAAHQALVDRWNVCLTNMVRDGAITQAQANTTKFPAVVPINTNPGWTGYQAYIMNLVQGEIGAYYPQYAGQLYTGGLKIYTSIKKRLMDGLYTAVRQNVHNMAVYGGRAVPKWLRIGAVLEQPGTGRIEAFYGGPGVGTPNCKATGCYQNTILNAEQVGSSFKPYVLTTAVSQGMNVKSSVLNSHSPLCIPPAGLGLQYQNMLSKQTTNCNTHIGYFLFNDPTENTRGNDSVAVATAQSNNPAFEDLIHKTSVASVVQMAQNLGVNPAEVKGLNDLFGPNGTYAGSVTAALGQGALTAVDQANTFATLVSGGTGVTPHIIDKIVTPSGTTVLPTGHLPAVKGVLPGVAADADWALSFDTTMAGGTGGNAALTPARPMIAKTGTLGSGSGASQAWFIGAIPQYSLAVTLYANLPGKHQYLDVLPSSGTWRGGYGGAWPATIFRTFMNEQLSGLAIKQLPPPPFAGVPWIQVPKNKKPPCQQQHGHKHGHGGQQQPCPSQSPSQSGSPSPSGSPSWSPSQSGSPSPSGSPSGSPSPSPSLGAKMAAAPNGSAGNPRPHPSKAAGAALASVAGLLPHKPSLPAPRRVPSGRG